MPMHSQALHLHTRYGFLLTNKELVAVKRLDRDGSLSLADPIPWGASGTEEQPRMTVLLRLWYLGLLAADDGWQLA